MATTLVATRASDEHAPAAPPGTERAGRRCPRGSARTGARAGGHRRSPRRRRTACAAWPSTPAGGRSASGARRTAAPSARGARPSARSPPVRAASASRRAGTPAAFAGAGGRAGAPARARCRRRPACRRRRAAAAARAGADEQRQLVERAPGSVDVAAARRARRGRAELQRGRRPVSAAERHRSIQRPARQVEPCARSAPGSSTGATSRSSPSRYCVVAADRVARRPGRPARGGASSAARCGRYCASAAREVRVELGAQLGVAPPDRQDVRRRRSAGAPCSGSVEAVGLRAHDPGDDAELDPARAAARASAARVAEREEAADVRAPQRDARQAHASAPGRTDDVSPSKPQSVVGSPPQTICECAAVPVQPERLKRASGRGALARTASRRAVVERRRSGCASPCPACRRPRRASAGVYSPKSSIQPS